MTSLEKVQRETHATLKNLGMEPHNQRKYTQCRPRGARTTTTKGVPGSRLRIGSYNSRGLRSSLEDVLQIFTGLDILFLNVTWLRECDTDLIQMVDEIARSLADGGKGKGSGGVVLIISPVRQYTVVARWETKTVQAIIIRVGGTNITGSYISPAAIATEEDQVLNQIKGPSTDRAIIIGEINARSTLWDKMSNARGRRLVKWAANNNWKIRTPKKPTFWAQNGVFSTLDISLMKGIPACKVAVPEREAHMREVNVNRYRQLSQSQSRRIRQKDGFPKKPKCFRI